MALYFYAPVIPVVICVAVYLDMYGTNEKCWLSYNNYVVMAMLGPILLFIVVSRLSWAW